MELFIISKTNYLKINNIEQMKFFYIVINVYNKLNPKAKKQMLNSYWNSESSCMQTY